MARRTTRCCAVAAVMALSTTPFAASTRADTVTDWDELATNELVADGQGGSALVHLAMVHAAVYDAVNAIDRRHTPYLIKPAAKRSYSTAAATAAFRVLVDSRPSVVQPVHQAQLVAAATCAVRHSARRHPGRPGQARGSGSSGSAWRRRRATNLRPACWVRTSGVIARRKPLDDSSSRPLRAGRSGRRDHSCAVLRGCDAGDDPACSRHSKA
jgi:hypothetical protein